MFQIAAVGFTTGFGLILAIGAQNAFILRQGIMRSHVLPVVLTCAISDAILIVLGVSSFAVISEMLPWITPVMRYGGAAFLIVYGLMALRSAWQGGGALRAAEGGPEPLGPVIATLLMLTWANPHVYLDTVVLIGSISAQFGADAVWFGTGAVISSFTFFFLLGYGARLLAPFFARPGSWRVLDLIVAGIMFTIAGKLILGA